jgi:large subunit ribosomal protein L25
LEVECLPKDLPEKIEVDVSELKGNQSIHVRDLKLAANVKILSNADQVVATVKFAKAEVVEAEAEVAAAPAAGAAAPAAGVATGSAAAPAAGAAKA